jgi:hypothetical protein
MSREQAAPPRMASHCMGILCTTHKGDPAMERDTALNEGPILGYLALALALAMMLAA